MKKDDKKQDLLPVIELSEVFDDQFSVLKFQEYLEEKKRSSKEAIQKVERALKKAIGSNAEKDEYRYFVNLDDNIKSAIESGELRFVTNNKGEVLAKLREKNGHFYANLSIEKELSVEGGSIEELQNAILTDAIYDKLIAIAETIKSIENKVEGVIRGQHNDRIGLFYSALSMYSEAVCINDENLKRQLTVQSLRAISDSSALLIQEMRESVEYLVNERYKKERKVTESINEHLSIINQCYDVLYKSYFLKASIYQKMDEMEALLMVLEEYARLVNMLIVPHVGKLTELDETCPFVETGKWGQIVKTINDCKVIRNQLMESDVLKIEEV